MATPSASCSSDDESYASFTTIATTTNAPGIAAAKQIGLTLRPFIGAVRPSEATGGEDAITPEDSISCVGCLSADKHVPLATLTAQDVVRLLRNVELGRYADNFLHLPMRGAELEHVTAADLEAIGVLEIHRRSLLRAIFSWRADGVPSPLIGDSESRDSERATDIEEPATPMTTTTAPLEPAVICKDPMSPFVDDDINTATQDHNGRSPTNLTLTARNVMRCPSRISCSSVSTSSSCFSTPMMSMAMAFPADTDPCGTNEATSGGLPLRAPMSPQTPTERAEAARLLERAHTLNAKGAFTHVASPETPSLILLRAVF